MQRKSGLEVPREVGAAGRESQSLDLLDDTSYRPGRSSLERSSCERTKKVTVVQVCRCLGTGSTRTCAIEQEQREKGQSLLTHILVRVHTRRSHLVMMEQHGRARRRFSTSAEVEIRDPKREPRARSERAAAYRALPCWQAPPIQS